jgi:large subunit ribosomal protein L18
MLEKVAKRQARHAVFRSNTAIYAQMIDDVASKTLCAASDMKAKSGSKTEKAASVGKAVAEAALALGIKECVFDRGGFMFHGRVKALAEAAREAGLKF